MRAAGGTAITAAGGLQYGGSSSSSIVGWLVTAGARHTS
jgi:hypothetical protein